MKHFPSFPVTITTRIVFHDADRELFELDQSELLRSLIYRLEVLQAAMKCVDRLQHEAGKEATP